MAAATRKYGAEIFNRENFREGGKFAPPTAATIIEARYFRRKRGERIIKGPEFRLSGLKTMKTALEPSKAEI